MASAALRSEPPCIREEHRAAYQFLQTEASGASDFLCQSEGLTDLGLVCASLL